MAENKNSVNATLVSQRTYPQSTFDTILVLTDKVTFPEATRTYQDLTALSSENSDADLQAYMSIGFAQQIRAKTFILAKRSKPQPAIASFTFDNSLDAVADGEFKVTVNGATFEFTGINFTTGTKAEALNLVLDPSIVAYDISPTVVELRTVETLDTSAITAITAIAVAVGTDISASLNSFLTANDTGSTGQTIKADLIALDEANTDYFGVLVFSDETQTDLKDLALYVESQDAMCVLYDNSPVAISTATTDLASELQALAYEKTSVFYHATDRTDIAFLSAFLGLDIGLINAKTMELKGVTPDTLTSTELTNVLAKNANVYTKERKRYLFTKQGTACSGKKIESVAGEIFITVKSIEGMYELLLNNDRISFDADDLNLLRVLVTTKLRQAQAQKIIALDDPQNGEAFTIDLVTDQAGGSCNVKVSYLKSGSVDWIDLSFSASIDADEYYINKA